MQIPSEFYCCVCLQKYKLKLFLTNLTQCPIVNLINILWAYYAPIFLRQKKLRSKTVTREKLRKTPLYKKGEGKVKLTPDVWRLVSISSILKKNFFCVQIPKAQKRQSSCQPFLCFWDLLAQTLLVELWWNWPLVFSRSFTEWGLKREVGKLE